MRSHLQGHLFVKHVPKIFHTYACRIGRLENQKCWAPLGMCIFWFISVLCELSTSKATDKAHKPRTLNIVYLQKCMTNSKLYTPSLPKCTKVYHFKHEKEPPRSYHEKQCDGSNPLTSVVQSLQLLSSSLMWGRDHCMVPSHCFS